MTDFKKFYHIFLIFTLANLISRSQQYSTDNGVTFYGEQRQSYLKFEHLYSNQSGIIMFKFRTTEPDGLLLYADDLNNTRGIGNFLKLALVKKQLVVSMQISYRESGFSRSKTKQQVLGHNLNDNFYHYVIIKMKEDGILINLDGQYTVIPSPDHYLQLSSFVFVGGAPIVRRRSMDKDLDFGKRFVGCISKLRYHGGMSTGQLHHAKLIEEHGVSQGCRDLCMIQPTLKCRHGGRCMNLYVKTACDCRGTGFTGHTCEERSRNLQFSGNEHMVWSPEINLNPHVIEILLRFKTKMSSGILFYAKGEGDKFVLLERFEKILILTSNTNGIKEDTIKIGDSQSNRTVWTFVRILRNRNYMSFSVSNRNTKREYQSAEHSARASIKSFDIKFVTVGGMNDTIHSMSKTHFNGCIQDVVVNKVDLIEKLYKNDASITPYGDIKEGCEIFPELEEPTENYSTSSSQETSVDTKQDISFLVKEVMDISDQGEEITIQKRHLGEQKNKSTVVWIVGTGVTGLVALILLIILISRHYINKRKERQSRYHEQYLRHTGINRGEEALLPIEQKFIRDEVAKRRLQTFSPIRRDFYHSTSDSGSIRRSIGETIYQTHEVINHPHPCLSNQNYAVPVTVVPAQSPHSSHYSVAKKCSHGPKYQTPNTKTGSIRSFNSQQS